MVSVVVVGEKTTQHTTSPRIRPAGCAPPHVPFPSLSFSHCLSLVHGLLVVTTIVVVLTTFVLTTTTAPSVRALTAITKASSALRLTSIPFTICTPIPIHPPYILPRPPPHFTALPVSQQPSYSSHTVSAHSPHSLL